jgi:hypothetical protein
MTILAVGLSFSASALANTPTTRVVGKPGTSCPNAQYTTITAAVNAAAPGDEIDICPALYREQLLITKPLTLRGLAVEDSKLSPSVSVKRALLQPSSMQDLDGLAVEAVITVMNTSDVDVENLAIDASKNAVTTCTPGLAAVHFFNASGRVHDSAIFGAKLANSQGCTTNLPFGNGWGVLVDSTLPGPFNVCVSNNSIHDFTANGVLVQNAGITANIDGNNVVGVGPSGGVFQFAVFIANGAVGHIRNNVLSEGNCGGLSVADCIGKRSEGVTLRAVGDGTVVDHNVIDRAQSGIFVNGANNARITNNLIENIDALSGMDIQGSASGFFTNGLIDGNVIVHIYPIDINATNDEEGCGIDEYSGTGVSGNTISHNTVNDAFCGVAAVTADQVREGHYFNTLYTQLNSDDYPSGFPPATEP